MELVFTADRLRDEKAPAGPHGVTTKNAFRRIRSLLKKHQELLETTESLWTEGTGRTDAKDNTSF